MPPVAATRAKSLPLWPWAIAHRKPPIATSRATYAGNGRGEDVERGEPLVNGPPAQSADHLAPTPEDEQEPAPEHHHGQHAEPD